jgi:hypothetical protein
VELVLIVIAIVVGFAIYSATQKAKELEAARQTYLKSLSELKQSPTDADVKQRALALGRAYSNLTRDKKGNTVFDEVALMNDINAACAAATATRPPSASSAPVAAGESVEERLRTLSSLKEKGLIETSEYDKRRTEILSSI